MSATPPTRPTLTALSLGAGVQSTNLLLLAAEGVLPRPDVAIFADTGWEPAAVYAQLDKLAAVAAAAGIELHRVSNGNLRDDATDPAHHYASIPYYIQGRPGPCWRCNATGRVPAADLPESPEAAGDTERCTRCRGTGWDDGKGIGRRQCTHEYKLAPITRKVRELLGAKPPAYRRVPAGRICEQWIGFSTDEIGRVSDHQRVGYLTSRYPLLELGVSRADCQRWLTARGWGSTVKSACIGCPFHGNRAWRDLRDNHPDEWAEAVAFDHAIRHGGARGAELRGTAYLHASRVPLDQAPIDRVTRREWTDAQVDLLDLLAEDGDQDGCSPYGCRSGQRATPPAMPADDEEVAA
jgi:hypothetical protein